MLSSLLGQNAQGLLPHKISISLGLCLVFLSDVIPAGSGGVVLAVGSQAAADPNAGAVELTNDPLLILRFSSRWRRIDEVSGPPQRQRLICQLKRWHDVLQVLLQEVVGESGKEWFLWTIIGVDGTSSTNCGDSSLLGLLVNDANQSISHQVVSELTFHNTRAETLIHKLAAGLLATLQVLANTLGCPFTGLGSSAVHAEFDKLTHGVFFLVVVIGLHQQKLLTILAGSLAIRSAVVALLELDNPDSFT
mmetsp:Transcript_41752/g.85089  ORF Transcript_41752/g.85089 Transcript_41752/m.85089 type:complete len:249 (-) Transcript_41752:5-751(-)